MPQVSAVRAIWVGAALVALVGCGSDDDGPTCAGLLPGDLVITEVLADVGAPTGSSGADEGGEWFEVYNATSRSLELEGLTIEHGRPDAEGNAIERHVLGAMTIGSGEYVVFGNALSDLLPDHVDYGYADALGGLYNTDGGRLALRCGTALIDDAVYAETAAGRSYALDGIAAPDYLVNDEATSWCETERDNALEYEPANYGTPGSFNPSCEAVVGGLCVENGTTRNSVPPEVGDLVITEVMPNPDLSDAVAEWFEVLVKRDVDLNGVGLARGTGTPNLLSSSDCMRATAGTYLIFAKSDDPTVNGGISGVDGTFTFDLVGGSEANPGSVRVLAGNVELDALTWTTSTNKHALQLDAGLTDVADNDDAANLCDATAAYNGDDYGTPGLANSDCDGVTAGTCVDGTTGQPRPIVPPSAGQLVINEWLHDPIDPLNDDMGEWFEVRATAAVDLNGLQAGVGTPRSAPIVPTSGACIRLNAGGLALFARAATGNGLPVAPAGVFTFSLPNNDERALVIGMSGAVLDTRTWTGSAADDGRSIMIDSNGNQCIAPDNVRDYYENNYGTPGTANVVLCPQ